MVQWCLGSFTSRSIHCLQGSSPCGGSFPPLGFPVVSASCFFAIRQRVVHILCSRTSKVPCIMRLLCHLLSAAARFNFTFTSQHIPSIHNNIADALSRFHWHEFRRLGPHGTALPSSSPSSALGALDPSSLEAQCHSFLVQGLAPSTRSSYGSDQKKF